MKIRNLTKLLSLLVISLAVTSCQQNPTQAIDEDEELTAIENFIPDEELDKAEAEFESLILTETPAPREPRENLWDELADHFEFLETPKSNYENYLTYFIRNSNHLERTSVRAHPYLHFIAEELKAREMPADLAMLPIIESAFYPYARSRMRAAGLWQFIPSTGQIYGLKQDWWYDGRQDLYSSTHAALNFLQNLYELNNQDWLLALASYNAGYGRVLRATKRLHAKSPNAEVNYWNIRPYLPRETRNYVPQLLAVSYLIKNREEYNITIKPIPNETYLVKVDLDKQLDLTKTAKLLGLSDDLIKHLNPGYLHKVTPPNGPHHLMIPQEKHEQLEKQLASYDQLFDIRWQRHYIVNGDNLGSLALRYKTSIKEIRNLNNLRGNIIRAGKTLLIPIPASHSTTPTQLAQTTQPKGAIKVHHVQAGENLGSIASYYGISTDKLVRWNNLDPKNFIQVGQELKIYSNKYGHTIKYRVKNGESLWLIANRHNVSVRDLARWNKINTKKPIQPGTNLTIWRKGNSGSYTVQQGDTIWDIAQLFNINSNQLQKHNNLSSQQMIKPGQVLKIPTTNTDS